MLAGAAGGALESRLHGQVLSKKRLLAAWSELLQVAARAEHDLLRVQDFAGQIGGAMLGAAPAFDAGVSLQAGGARDVPSRCKPKVLVAGERRNAAEAGPSEEHREGTQDQVKVLRARDDRQKHQQGDAVRPPGESASCAG